MDRVTEKFVLDLLHKLKAEMAVIFISHRLHVLKKSSDRIYVLENGAVKAHGNHEALLKSENIYSEYWKEISLVN